MSSNEEKLEHLVKKSKPTIQPTDIRAKMDNRHFAKLLYADNTWKDDFYNGCSPNWTTESQFERGDETVASDKFQGETLEVRMAQIREHLACFNHVMENSGSSERATSYAKGLQLIELLREHIFWCDGLMRLFEKGAIEFSQSPDFMDELHRVALRENELRTDGEAGVSNHSPANTKSCT